MLIWIHDINNTKQIFHAYLLNIDIKQIGMEWIRVNKKQKKKGMEHLFYHMPPTPNKIWEDKG